MKRKDGDPVWSTNAWIADSDRSMGLAFDGDVRAVPIKMLNSHEIDQNLEKTPATSGKMKMAHFGAKPVLQILAKGSIKAPQFGSHCHIVTPQPQCG